MPFTATFFPEGRVDAILLECDGEYAFVDGGYRRNGLRLVKHLRSLGVTKLRYYIASHGHKNHVGAAAPIIEAFRPEAIIAPRKEVVLAIRKFAKNKAERTAIADAQPRTIQMGQYFDLGGARITCLGPKKQKDVSTGAYAENYNSLILRVDYDGNPELLLTGDTTAAIIAKCQEAARARVLKSPHHAGSQPASLLRQVDPSVVVICSNAKAGAAYSKRIKSAGAQVRNVCQGRVVI